MLGKLLNLKKPKDVGMKEWSAGVELTLTGAQFQREQAPGHSPSCQCAYGRFWLKRQSSLLLHSCWPNTAHVKRPAPVPAGSSSSSLPAHLREVHSILATTDIPAGAVLTDCMNAALLSLPKERRMQWIAHTTGKAACPCDRCQTPRKLDASLTANVGGVKLNPSKLEEEYEGLIRQYTHLNSMARTIPDDPAFNSPLLDEKYLDACYLFLSSIHTFLTCYHSLSPLHWRKQYLRNLFVTLVAKNELYDLDLMHPLPAGGALVVQRPPKPAGRAASSNNQSLTPGSKAWEDRRQKHHFYLQMILTQVLSHLECNAQFYPSHEPLKCSAIFLLYSLIEWFAREENEYCRVRLTKEKGGESEERIVSCFTFAFDQRKKDLAGYLADKLKQMEPQAEWFLAAAFPLRA
jgi:hypothetical protein